MPAAWKDPDVALQIRQELDVDMILGGRHIVTQSVHGIGRGPLGSYVAQRIARSCGHDAKIRVERPLPRLQTPSTPTALDAQYARFLQLRSGLFGAIKQHTVQVHA